MKMLAEGQKVEYQGMQVDPRYRWRNDTLIQRFSITPDEERQLQTIISRTEAARRDAVRARVKREAAGAATRDAWLASHEQKRISARLARAQGKSWAEIATVVGYPSADAARKACA
ncbi:hypothetical protein Cthiooxydans_37270 [Comamonas thiooxydans]|nr:hypothetical protein Cthiooxydans_37270 [Comamonas thiooxydans]